MPGAVVAAGAAALPPARSWLSSPRPPRVRLRLRPRLVCQATVVAAGVAAGAAAAAALAEKKPEDGEGAAGAAVVASGSAHVGRQRRSHSHPWHRTEVREPVGRRGDHDICRSRRGNAGATPGSDKSADLAEARLCRLDRRGEGLGQAARDGRR